MTSLDALYLHLILNGVLSFYLGTKGRETEELLPDRNAVPYPHKWRAEICMQIYGWVLSS